MEKDGNDDKPILAAVVVFDWNSQSLSDDVMAANR